MPHAGGAIRQIATKPERGISLLQSTAAWLTAQYQLSAGGPIRQYSSVSLSDPPIPAAAAAIDPAHDPAQSPQGSCKATQGTFRAADLVIDRIEQPKAQQQLQVS